MDDSVRRVQSGALGHPVAVGRHAWFLAIANAVAATVIGLDLVGLDSPDPSHLVPVWAVVALFTIAEVAAVRLEIRGIAVVVAMRSTPLLVGLFYLAPIEVVAAHVVGISIALLVRERPSAPVAGVIVASCALGTVVAAVLFHALAGPTPHTSPGWWIVPYAAVVAASGVFTVGAAYGRVDPELLRRGRSLAGLLGLGAIATLVEASLGMTVVLFLGSDPAELWLLAGPAAVAALAYRAYAGQRRRHQRIEFLYACASILDGPSSGAAMLDELLDRTRDMLHADTAEIVVCRPEGAPLRAVVGPGPAHELLAETAEHEAARRLALVPAGTRVTRRRATTPAEGLARAASGIRVEAMDAVVARFDGGTRTSGVLIVAGRPPGLPFQPDDARLLEALADKVAAAMGRSRVIEELAASLGDASHLEALVAASDDAMIGFGADGTVVSWNPAATGLFGYPPDAVIGNARWLPIVEASLAGMTAAFRRARGGEAVRDLQVDIVRPDGSVVPISASMMPIRATDGRPVGVSVIARDVTTPTLQATALRESLDRFRSVFEGSPLGMGVIGSDFTWQRVNEALCRTLGVGEDELMGRRFEVLLDRDDIAAAHGLVSRLLRGETAGSAIEVGLRAADRVVIASFAVRPLRIPDGQVQALCTIDDVSERRRAEDRARETDALVHGALLEMAAIREPAGVLQALMRAARAVTGAASAAVRVPGPAETGGAEIACATDDPSPETTRAAIEGDGRLDPGRIALQPLRRPSDDTLRSVLAAPIGTEGRTHALLVLLDKQDGPEFTDDDVARAASLAAQAAISLENARAHQRALALVRELDEANAALQQASQAKTAFLASVSHELRTPLHAILLAAQLLHDGPPGRIGPAAAKALPATIEDSGRHLLALIDDLIDLSRAEISEIRLRVIETDVPSLLGEVRRQVRPLAAAKGIRLAISDGRGQRVTADPLRLRQVLLNLVANAIKFTPSGGRVRLTVAREGEALTFRVHDTGVGIAPGEVERIFQPFERIGGDESAGAGLGLAIARRIVELHGGALTATSTPGSGSTFVVRLPAAPGAADAGACAATGRQGGGRRVLVVDDDVESLELTSRILTEAGYAVLLATGVTDARRRLAFDRPHAVVLDRRLPDGDGLALLRELRARPGMSGLPVVVLSATAAPGDAVAARAAGASDHLDKPVAAEALLECLARIEDERPALPGDRVPEVTSV